MTTTNGWPGKPGVPLNPERDGWHWLKRISNGWETPAKWDNDWNGNDDFWWNLPQYSDPERVAEDFCYLGPCLTPDEAAALQKRVAELEGALLDLMLPQTPASFAGSMRVARAALEGRKP